MKIKEHKKRKPKWRLRIEHQKPRMRESTVEEFHYPNHAAAMRAMRRRLLVLWRGNVVHYRMGVNQLRNDPWCVMAHEVAEGMYLAGAVLDGVREVKAGLGRMLEKIEARKDIGDRVTVSPPKAAIGEGFR